LQTLCSSKVHLTYSVSAHALTENSSLVDRGAYGGVGGEDVHVLPMGLSPHKHVNVRGINNHEMTDIPIAGVGGVTPTQRGDVIAIFHQYAYVGRGKTIHSSGQLEFFRNKVNDKSIKVGGHQRIVTIDGYVMPLDIRQGLPYLKLRPYTDEEWESLPHVIMTSDADWDPSVLDYIYDDEDPIWYDAMEPGSYDFDEYGDYRHHTIAYTNCTSEIDIDNPSNHYNLDNIIESCVHYAHTSVVDDHCTYLSFEHSVQTTPPDYASLQRYFAYLPVDVIQHTFKNSTQYAKTSISTILKKH